MWIWTEQFGRVSETDPDAVNEVRGVAENDVSFHKYSQDTRGGCEAYSGLDPGLILEEDSARSVLVGVSGLEEVFDGARGGALRFMLSTATNWRTVTLYFK